MGKVTSIEIYCIQPEEDLMMGEYSGLFLEDPIRTIRMPGAKDLIIVLGNYSGR